MLDNSYLQIDSNIVRDARIDLNNTSAQASGFEIASQNDNVSITNNDIAYNLGAGIGANPGAKGTNFVITGNNIHDNGLDLSGLPGTGIQEFGDCFTLRKRPLVQLISD